MVRWDVDKAAATRVLEAVKETIQHLSRLRIEDGDGHTSPDEDGLVEVYGRVRRLREYVRRSVGAFSTAVELDLEDDDASLLAACLFHRAQSLEERGREGDRRDAELVERTLTEHLQLAVNLGRPGFEPLPGDQARGRLTPRVRAALATMRGRWSSASGSGDDGKPTAGGSSDPSKVVPEALTLGYGTIDLGAKAPDDAASTAGPPGAGVDAPRPEFGSGVSELVLSAGSTEPPREAPPGPQSARNEPAAEAAPSADRASGSAPRRSALRLNGNLIREPRLRSLVKVDQRALQRALAANDYRLAAVHLLSLFEAVVIDHAQLHVAELGLNGSPDSWNLGAIVRSAIGEDMEAADRSLLIQLVTARNALSPAKQLQRPLAMNGRLYDELEAFVARTISTLGLPGPA